MPNLFLLQLSFSTIGAPLECSTCTSWLTFVDLKYVRSSADQNGIRIIARCNLLDKRLSRECAPPNSDPHEGSQLQSTCYGSNSIRPSRLPLKLLLIRVFSMLSQSCLIFVKKSCKNLTGLRVNLEPLSFTIRPSILMIALLSLSEFNALFGLGRVSCRSEINPMMTTQIPPITGRDLELGYKGSKSDFRSSYPIYITRNISYISNLASILT